MGEATCNDIGKDKRKSTRAHRNRPVMGKKGFADVGRGGGQPESHKCFHSAEQMVVADPVRHLLLITPFFLANRTPVLLRATGGWTPSGGLYLSKPTTIIFPNFPGSLAARGSHVFMS